MDSFEAFKKIRNQLRKLDRDSLVIIVIQKLRSIEGKEPNEWHSFLPWRLLLLLKWGFEFCGENYPLIISDELMLAKLINKVHTFEEAEQNPFLEQGDVGGINKFLRTLSFQQFWLQREMYYLDIARQIELFCNLPPDDFLRHEIENYLDGMDLKEFISFFWLIWVWAAEKPTNLAFNNEIIFGNTRITDEVINKFLGLISLQANEIKKYLQERKDKIKNPYFQLLERSPFVRYPILRSNNGYLLYSEKLIIEAITNYFYDTMKTIGGSNLFERFGQIFEEYISKSLNFINDEVISERVLMRSFSGQKVTDFLIPYTEFNLLIELKAIELNQIARVNPTNAILSTELRDSICKGVIQGFSLANSILQDNDSLSIPNRRDFFLLIITYKNIYLGRGEDAWIEFLKESVSKYLLENSIDQDIIPPDRIMFMSISEFDQLISIIFNEKASISDILFKVVENNKHSTTRKFSFSQHLTEWLEEDHLKHPFLDQTFERFIKELGVIWRK